MPTKTQSYWRRERADRAALVVDAENYFHHAREAMLNARDAIMMVGWDFDARIKLELDDPAVQDEELGDFIYRLVKENPRLDVYLLRWRLGALKILLRGKTILTLIKWWLHPRIHLRLDGATPHAASHHQKIVVIDDTFAFCGGIDMTADRWDTREHLDEDPKRIRPSGRAYGPWHDATTALSGPVAAALGDLVRLRWKRAGGGELPVPENEEDCWPDTLAPQFRDVDVDIARTLPEMPKWDAVLEVESMFLEQIRRAKRYIYVESQYFAARAVAEVMAERLAEADGPEIVIINPLTAEGWLEPKAMDSARARLYRAIKEHDPNGRLRIYHPVTARGTPIYVHAKIMIIDDELMRVGSANLNNRSLRLDTECDVAIDTAVPQNSGHDDVVRANLLSLVGEHLGVSTEIVDSALTKEGSLLAAIESLRVPEDAGQRTLVPYQIPDLDTVDAFLADNQVLDPEGPSAMFEEFSKRQLLRGFVKKVRRKPSY
ncbi:phospholipase [Pacificimonas sp. WHA3]|uniref:Phospholipase D n=1 Tax=Pacificimonas pallii TaxID=2827236 RepID=A0ABS6SEV0_9SPHN|nr:phospholipase D-like domain-containing protein [Pacificimonas pallii]MBV7256623.1 phospholipase [Pacificimonas pallii]